ncbi:ABC transporter permease [Thiomicrorhabdus cannonii]|uniref:ABC transporter permease n=1 Tax=Thiomicrorhabdus cannonii TaxID=2748011 RepID=UPI001C4AA278|nr:ABC transporter permease [Thiomicrorhabdus cannonii]
MMSLRRLLAVFRKEVWQLKRDRLTIAMIFGIPIIQILLFGYAINTDIRAIPTVVLNQSHSQLSRDLLSDLQASQVIKLKGNVHHVEEIETLLRQGKISIGIVIPPDFERRLQDSSRAAAQLLVDGSDPIILGAAKQLTAMPFHLNSQSVPPQNRLFEVRHFYNPEKRSAMNTIPGLIGVILTMTMVIFTAISLVRERERGNLELLINTPITSNELMLGKMLPYIAIGFFQVTLIMLLGLVIFDVPVRGQLVDVYIAALVFIAANLTLGLLFSTLAKSQLQALQMTIFIMLPSILLSGFMFPFDGMPEAAQWIAEILPLTHFERLIRGIILRGADLSELWPELLALIAFASVTMLLALKRFRKRLD